MLGGNEQSSFHFKKHSDILNEKPTTEEQTDKLVEEIKRRGNLAFKGRHYEEAEVLYTHAIELKPDIVVSSLRK